MTFKVRPCPFCGARGESKMIKAMKTDTDLISLFCLRCGARGPIASRVEKAVQLWNAE